MPPVIPPAARTLIIRCWAQDPNKRPPFWQIVQELRKIDKEISSLPLDMDDCPSAFLCPITYEVMRDPVFCTDGHTYERSAIIAWFAKGKTTSPITNQVLPSLETFPNHNLRSQIQGFLQEKNKK